MNPLSEFLDCGCKVWEDGATNQGSWRGVPRPLDQKKFLMKCREHNSVEVIGVCLNCGRAVCSACAASPASALSPAPSPLVCSRACAEDLTRRNGALELLVERSVQSARASAVYYFLSAGVSGGAAVAAWFWLPSPILICFAGGSAVALASAGVWHGRGAKARKVPGPAVKLA